MSGKSSHDRYREALSCLDRAENYQRDGLATAVALAYSVHRDAIRAALEYMATITRPHHPTCPCTYCT